MSLREIINRSSSLHGVKRLIAPLWVSINGRVGQDAWLHTMLRKATTPISTIVDVGSSGGFFYEKRMFTSLMQSTITLSRGLTPPEM